MVRNIWGVAEEALLNNLTYFSWKGREVRIFAWDYDFGDVVYRWVDKHRHHYLTN
jgi:hypothetical protein